MVKAFLMTALAVSVGLILAATLRSMFAGKVA